MSKEPSLEDEIPEGGLIGNEARNFIYGQQKETKAAPKPTAKTKQTIPAKTYRQPYTVKLRSEVVEAIDRISTFSKFRGDKLTKQAIVEEAIEQWVDEHKHLMEVPKNL